MVKILTMRRTKQDGLILLDWGTWKKNQFHPPLIFLHPIGLVTFADGISKCCKSMEKSAGLMGSRSMGIPEFNEVCTSRKLRSGRWPLESWECHNWVVATLTNMFQMGWTHQLDNYHDVFCSYSSSDLVQKKKEHSLTLLWWPKWVCLACNWKRLRPWLWEKASWNQR